MKQGREWGRERSGGELAVTAVMETVNFGKARMAKFTLNVACSV